MKKKVRLGMSFWIIFYNLIISGIIIFVVTCCIIKSADRTFIGESIKLIVISLLVGLFGFSVEQKFNSFIQIFDNKLVLQTFLKEKKEYYKDKIVIHYAIQEHRGRGAYTCPCFVIGIWMGSTFRYTKNKFIYDNYFLLLLDSKKLNIILSWYDDEIQLPEEEEINALRDKKVKKFYEIIKLHNERISKQQKAK